MAVKSEAIQTKFARYIALPAVGLLIGMGVSELAMNPQFNFWAGSTANVALLGLSAYSLLSKKVRSEAPYLSAGGAAMGGAIIGNIGYNGLQALSFI